jgi:hypothetical protein
MTHPLHVQDVWRGCGGGKRWTNGVTTPIDVVKKEEKEVNGGAILDEAKIWDTKEKCIWTIV